MQYMLASRRSPRPSFLYTMKHIKSSVSAPSCGASDERRLSKPLSVSVAISAVENKPWQFVLSAHPGHPAGIPASSLDHSNPLSSVNFFPQRLSLCLSPFLKYLPVSGCGRNSRRISTSDERNCA